MDPQLGGGKDVQKGLHWLGSFSIYLPITYLRLQKSKFKTAATFWDQKDTQNKVKKKKKEEKLTDGHYITTKDLQRAAQFNYKFKNTNTNITVGKTC